MIASVARFPERISSEEKQMRIDRRKHNRLGAQHSEILRLHGHRQNSLGLTSSSIEARQFTSDDNARIQRIGDDVTVFLGCDPLPIAKRNLALVAATCDFDRATLLLATV